MEATLKPRRRDLEEKKGKEIMNAKQLEKDKYTNEEKIDSKEFSEELNKLPRKEQEKILYMIKGAALVTEAGKQTQSAI